MYKSEKFRQLGLADFNQPIGLKMNPENRWVKKAAAIPWNKIEERYARLFPSKTGMPAKLLRVALGRPKKAEKIDKKEAYQDNADWIAVERAFALAKHSYGLGLITSRLDTTTGSSIALSIIAMSVDRIVRDILWRILISIFSMCKRQEILPQT